MDKKPSEFVKLAIFDLDDTLLRHGCMSQEDHDAVCSLRKLGIVTVTATSRDKTQVSEYVRECFDYLITINGASVESYDGNIISHVHMDRKSVHSIIRELHGLGAKTFLYCNGHLIMSIGACLRLIASRPLKDILKNKSTGWDSEITGRPCARAMRSPYRLYKVCGIFRTPEDRDRAMSTFSGRSEIQAIAAPVNIIEIQSNEATKETAVSLLCRHLKINRKQTVAFGDSKNDIEMLRASGISVAMENGEQCVKDIATIIASDVQSSGVSKVVHDLFRSNLE